MQKIFIITLVLLASLITACSKLSIAHRVTQADKIPRSQALAVISIQFTDEIDDLKEKKHLIHQSQALAENPELVEKKIRIIGKPALYMPLHHIYDFRFYFQDPQGNTHIVQKFNLDLRDYENISIYAFKPGVWTLTQIRYNFIAFKERTNNAPPEEYHVYQATLNIPKASFKLQAGKVHYLGNLSLHYQSEQMKYGFFPVRYLNKYVKLQRLEWKKQPTKTQQHLKNKQHWFRFSSWIDLSRSADWAYLENKEWKTYTAPVENQDLETKDSETFF